MAKVKIQVVLRNGKLQPATEYDAMQLSDHKENSTFALHRTNHRSNPHHALYWAALRNACDATGMWPTEQHLHHELKLACGYYKTTISQFTGGIVRSTDSISFSEMDQIEFNKYFELAMGKLAEVIGYDPLSLKG